ncbi:MAG: hypothetical protein MZV70_10545 [Desulfobacterales bacterium]|nr:hypothetical protein [Desulfobacterales bacterium]
MDRDPQLVADRLDGVSAGPASGRFEAGEEVDGKDARASAAGGCGRRPGSPRRR